MNIRVFAGCIVFIALAGFLVAGRGKQKRQEPDPVPSVRELPSPLPTVEVSQTGKPVELKQAADRLVGSLQTKCTKCNGTGKTSKAGKPRPGQIFTPRDTVDCPACKGAGKVDGSVEDVDKAANVMVKVLSRTDINADGGADACQKAFESVKTAIIAERRVYQYSNGKAAAKLGIAQPKIGEPVLVKVLYSCAVPNPDKPEDKVYLVRVAGKSRVLAIVDARLPDTPPAGGRCMVGGLIAGTIDAAGEPVTVIEHGFIIAPDVDYGWWNDE